MKIFLLGQKILNNTQNWSGHGFAREIAQAKKVSIVTFLLGHARAALLATLKACCQFLI